MLEEPKVEVREVLGDLFQLYMQYELQDSRADAMEVSLSAFNALVNN